LEDEEDGSSGLRHDGNDKEDEEEPKEEGRKRTTRRKVERGPQGGR